MGKKEEELEMRFGDEYTYTLFENPSYEDAIVGYTYDSVDSSIVRIIYSYEKIIEIILANMVFDESLSSDEVFEEVFEYYEYNIERALPYMGESAPIILKELLNVTS